MAKFFGLSPKPGTVKVTEEFENKMNIRRNNRMLLGRVYTDISDEEWSVAVAYNQVLDPGLWGTENALEIKYTYQPVSQSVITRFETGMDADKIFPATEFESPDSFVVWALNQEKDLMRNPT